MLRKLILISCLCLPLLSFSKKKKKLPVPVQVTAGSIDYRQMGAPLPPVRVVKLNKDIITEKSLKGGGNLIVMMFNPTCEHCEDMTLAIEKNTDLFRKTDVLMVAAANMTPYIGDFIKAMNTDKYPKLQIGVDSSKIIDKLYSYYSLPQLNIYNKDRKLIKMFSGITTMESLKAYVD